MTQTELPQTSEPDSGSPESWEEARRIASIIGPAPRFFTATIHFLKKDIADNQGNMGRNSRSCLFQLLRSGSFRAALYYGGLTFWEKDFKGRSLSTRRAFMKVYQPKELIPIIALLYIQRRIRKGCGPELWPQISERLLIESEVGGLIGKSMPKIGFQTGLLVGALPYLGLAMFMGIDKKGYGRLQNKLKKKEKYFDIALEELFWGCNHAQIGVLLLQALGVGRTFCDDLYAGLTARTLEKAEEHSGAYRFKIARVWIEALLSTGKPPDMTHRGEYYPLADDLSYLLEQVERIRQQGSMNRWLERGKDDLNPKDTPELFESTAEEIPAEPEEEEFTEVPEFDTADLDDV